MEATVLSTEAPKDLLAMAIMERGKLNQDMATEVEATSTEQLKVLLEVTTARDLLSLDMDMSLESVIITEVLKEFRDMDMEDTIKELPNLDIATAMVVIAISM